MSKSLKALEMLEVWATNGYTACLPEEATRLSAIIEKELKALEIIKRFSHYDLAFLDYLLSEGKITQEEYDLLKEVLL